MMLPACFKAYDIRGRVPDELDEAMAYRIGRAFVDVMAARRVAVGGDIRLSTPALKAALIRGLQDGGADVLDLGMTGTEEVYFAAFHLDVDGGIEVTASHNPIDFNGMKLVAGGARPLDSDTELQAIAQLVQSGQFTAAGQPGTVQAVDLLAPYTDHLLGYIATAQLRPLRIVVNAGNGAAGQVIDALETRLCAMGAPLQFIKLNHAPDGHFPKGIPNPLLPENRAETADAVRAHGADLGIAWDGDFDRCFFFDEQGRFIEGYYVVGLLAEAFLLQQPGQKIIHDPRLTWNTLQLVAAAGGQAIQSKTGHAFIKARMREEDAVYGGEMSAHHYFRDFAYCDSGMIPWLLLVQLLSARGLALSQLVDARIAAFPSSGEINRQIANPTAAIANIKAIYADHALLMDETDGLSLEFAEWRFNLRCSNTEALVRLNVESRADIALMQQQTQVLLALLDEHHD
ncbi:Phosphomannomutase/phosphoglucomutase [Andreprevotia sp. IGB-42]|uniref:phosphomannomutase CpsG n=1 Tax=Andreprevotia sp. IGB-42 TaxID=2497473 RepID=UPI00157E5A78|nr:phosphomannomutase CpsG [Andreprevotia sp. IGB-42]KAF0811502.1 Phosphomannomutase/phosphoglucomutase [Andreprevotia sp. IGB-42]